jgi:Domain of unknown function (DUF4410)
MLDTDPPEEPLMFYSLAGRGISVSFVLASAFGISLTFAQPQATESPVPSIPILISDFELYSVSAAATPLATPPATPIATPLATPSAAPIATSPATPISTLPAKPIATPPVTPAAALSKQKPSLPPVDGGADLPSVQARRLTDFFAATLLQILQKNGYNATRAIGQNPPSGAVLRGVFAEPDAKNRIRRTLLGGTSANPRFFLYVGIFNLARPDEPLYQLAEEQPGGNQFGPVITLNNYIPLAKYEIDKNPSEEDVRKICAQIAASLTALLAANSNAFSQ